jgi:dihydrofolate reductase
MTPKRIISRAHDPPEARQRKEIEMGKIVVTEFITLDGVIESPGGGEGFKHDGWSFKFNRGEEGDKFKFDELMASDVQLLGRITYEGFAKAWPSMTELGEFGEKMNAMPKYVVSTTLTAETADWNNSTVIGEDVPAQVLRLKEQVAGDILVAGSARLVRTLAEHDLVDEYRLMVFPIVLGSGKRLFGDGTPHTVLRLVDSTPIGPDGVCILTYEPVVEGARQSSSD